MPLGRDGREGEGEGGGEGGLPEAIMMPEAPDSHRYMTHIYEYMIYDAS